MESVEVEGTPGLYPGEILETIGGYPTIHHYQAPSDATLSSQQQQKPMIVCIPGGLHLARVFYGGHKGSRHSDFLAFWLARHGYPVLALSYPLETEPELMPPTHADFRISDWGRQAALTTLNIMETKSLESRKFILISWSMGGRMVVQFSASAKELGLEVVQYLSFSATPGFSSIRPLPPGIVCSGAGYFHVPPHVEVFCSQLDEMTKLNDEGESIPKDIYLREYIGATPVNLIGLGLKYDGMGMFIQDEKRHEEDSRVLEISHYPIISALYPTSILDASHALADQTSWGFLLTYKLESMISNEGLARLRGSSNWERVVELVHGAPKRLCRPVPGNHFFFIGEKSARQVAEQVDHLMEEVKSIKNELSTLLQI